MAFVHGKKSTFKLALIATPTVITGAAIITVYLTEAGFPSTADVAETTTFGITDKTYIAGLRDHRLTISGVYDSVVDGQIWDALGWDVGLLAWEYGPNAGAVPKYSQIGSAAGQGAAGAVGAIVTSYQPGGSVSDRVGFTAEAQTSGVVARA